MREGKGRASPGKTMKVGLIGFGAIGRKLVECCAEADELTVDGLCVRSRYLNRAKALVSRTCRVVDTVDELLAMSPDVVVECASQDALRDYGAQVLNGGSDLIAVSIGALADEEFRRILYSTAERAGRVVHLPAGAIAGLDGLASMSEAGLEAVHYISTKPPRAWIGTAAEQQFTLADIDCRTVLFEGTARDAALLYPRNANVAAIVALAGIGLDETCVTLVADPAVVTNIGEVRASGASGSLNVVVDGVAAPGNDKTSLSTVYSLLSSLKKMTSNVRL